MRNDLRVIGAEIKKMYEIWLTYPVLILFWAIFPVLWVVPFLFQGRAFVGGFTSLPFKSLAGTENYVGYILIGMIVSTYVFSGLWGVGNSLREETYWGTLELIIVSPTKPVVVLIGKTITEFIYATLMVVLQGALCVGFFGLSLTIGKILPILLILLLLLLGFYGFAIAFAGLTLLVKEVQGFIQTMEWVFLLFSPIRYPVEVNPITKFASMFIPLTYAIVAIRAIMLLNKSFFQLYQVVFILLAMDVVFIIGGYFIFVAAERYTRRTGTLAMH